MRESDFVESVMRAKKYALQAFKNRKRWSRVIDMHTLDRWTEISDAMFQDRSMDDTIAFLTDMYECMDWVVGRFIDMHKKTPRSWHDFECGFYVQMHMHLMNHTRTIYSDLDIYVLIGHMAYTLNELGKDLPKPIDLMKLKKDDIRLMKRILADWTKHVKGHREQIAWGVRFEMSALRQASKPQD